MKINRTFDDGYDIPFSKGLLIICLKRHWIGIKKRSVYIGDERQLQLWLGFVWVEWSPWVFWG